jgi:hypothetical protein
MSFHDEILALVEVYKTETHSFEVKGIKAAAARARKALGDLGKLTKSRRAEIQEKKAALSVK